MRTLRAVHRIITVIVVLFTLYLGSTGTLIQLIDLRTLFEKAPATDANMRSLREGFDEPGSFQVISTGDYTAAPLNRNQDPFNLLQTVLSSARAPLAPRRCASLNSVSWTESRSARSTPAANCCALTR